MSRPENLQFRISLRFVYEWCVRGPRDQIRESEANVGVPFQEGLGYPDVGGIIGRRHDSCLEFVQSMWQRQIGRASCRERVSR